MADKKGTSWRDALNAWYMYGDPLNHMRNAAGFITNPINAGVKQEFGVEPTAKEVAALRSGIQGPVEGSPQDSPIPGGRGNVRLGKRTDPLTFNDGLSPSDLDGIYTNPNRIVGPMPAPAAKTDPNSLQFEDGGFTTEADHRNYNFPKYGPPAQEAVATRSAFNRPQVRYDQVVNIPETRYATVDPLNLFGNRNGVNPFASNGRPITMDRFSGGVVPNSANQIRVDKNFNNTLGMF